MRSNSDEPCIQVVRELSVMVVAADYQFNSDPSYWMSVDTDKALILSESIYLDTTLNKFKVYRVEFVEEYTLDEINRDTKLKEYYNIRTTPVCIIPSTGAISGSLKAGFTVVDVDTDLNRVIAKRVGGSKNQLTVFFWQ